MSQSGRIAVVHNGIIENYAELKEQLLHKGYGFRSETDTEVVAPACWTTTMPTAATSLRP